MDSCNAFSFFTLQDSSVEAAGTIDTKGDPLRKRAAHRKSRNGCAQCRRKKIKCDEKAPMCSSCSRSKLTCDFPTRSVHLKKCVKTFTPPQTPQSSTQQSPTSSWALTKSTRPPELPDTQLDNLMGLILRRSVQEIELLRHFEKHTSIVLAMSRSIWSTAVLRLALQYDCLMDGIFLVAAAHKNYHLPAGHPDRKPLFHLYGKALSSLQVALCQSCATGMTTTDFDALLSSSLLIHHYSWTFIDEGATLACTFDETVNLSRGFKHLVIVGQDVAMSGQWWRVLGYSPKINLERYAREADPKEDLLGDMLFHCFFCGQGSRDPEGSSADNMYAATRMVIVLRAIFLALPNIETSGYGSDILRYLFTWPSLCTKGYMEQVRDGNLTSLTLLMAYYAAILRVHSEKTWFLRDKATFMYKALRQKLEGRCARCLKPVLLLYDDRCAESYSSMSREDVRSSVLDS